MNKYYPVNVVVACSVFNKIDFYSNILEKKSVLSGEYLGKIIHEH